MLVPNELVEIALLTSGHLILIEKRKSRFVEADGLLRSVHPHRPRDTNESGMTLRFRPHAGRVIPKLARHVRRDGGVPAGMLVEAAFIEFVRTSAWRRQ